MPAHKKSAKELKGEGAKEVLLKLGKFLKKHKLVSKAARVGEKVAPKKHKGKIKAAGDIADLLGYGLAPAGGGALKLAGQGKKKRGRPKKK